MSAGPKVRVRAAAARQAKLDLLLLAAETFVDDEDGSSLKRLFDLGKAATAFVEADRASPQYAKRNQ
jgi:hypothetical protein